MRRDVLRRVRWGNVALAATVITILAAVVAWPRLAPAPPALPPDTARPLVSDEPAGGAAPASKVTKARGRHAAPRGAARRSGAKQAGAKQARGRKARRRKAGGEGAARTRGERRTDAGRRGDPVGRRRAVNPRRTGAGTAPAEPRWRVPAVPRVRTGPAGGEFSFEGGR
jgi:hypothetical protein